MAEILLKDWAANHGVSTRTAQQWAKERRIPAKKRKQRIVMEKMWTCYVIESAAEPPEDVKPK